MNALRYSRRSRLRILSLAIAMLLGTIYVLPALGQDQGAPLPMTNAEVIKLVKGGLNNELIIKAIRSRPNHFDLSADAMLNLKGNGVPDNVIEAMMSGPASTATQPQVEPAGIQVDNSFWLYDGDKKIRLEQTRVTAEGKAGIGAAFGGATHAYFTLSEAGPRSAVRTSNKNPRFGEVLVPEGRRIAELVQLVKLQMDDSGKHRRVEAMKAAAFRSTHTGIPDSARVPMVFEELGKITYKGATQNNYAFKPEAPLPPGEYAVVIGGRVFFDFGVD